jgi:uncharacterized RDD family membrane protein YckC
MSDAYKIIGADGREYGPATLEELQAWAREGRIGRQTKVWSDREERWQDAAALTELQELAAALPSVPEAGGNATEGVEVGRSAGFWIRFLAYWPDQLLIAAAVLVIMGMPEFPAGTTPDMKAMTEWTRAAQPWIMAFSAVYYILTTWVWGASLGKLMFGLRVVRVDNAPVGFKEAALRFLGSVVSQTIFFFGYLFIALRDDKRALHDLLAGTKVVHRR